MKAADFTKIETKLAWLRMTNLKPSSQHVLFVEAVGERATSLPSETLVAWTDPALPAFVDVICLQLMITSSLSIFPFSLSFAASYSASRGQHSRGRFNDYTLSGTGQPSAHHLPLCGRPLVASGHCAAYGDSHTQRDGGHGACFLLCGQRLRSAHAGDQAH